jgi:hypothetical protein
LRPFVFFASICGFARRCLRSYQSRGGRLTYLAWKGRDAASDAAGYCRKLIGQSGKSRAWKTGSRARMGGAMTA